MQKQSWHGDPRLRDNHMLQWTGTESRVLVNWNAKGDTRPYARICYRSTIGRTRRLPRHRNQLLTPWPPALRSHSHFALTYVLTAQPLNALCIHHSESLVSG